MNKRSRKTGKDWNALNVSSDGSQPVLLFYVYYYVPNFEFKFEIRKLYFRHLESNFVFPRCILETEFAPVAEDSYNEDDEDSCGSTVGVGGATGPTPPDSPQMGREKVRAARSISQQYSYQYTGKIVPELDIYAIPCKEGMLT